MKNVTAVSIGKMPDNLANSDLPYYSPAPQAGFPLPADDLVETSLNIHDLVVKHPEATFFVRVEGDSMEGVGIFFGDVLVVDRAVAPQAGRVVVAVVEGGLVVKRLKVIAGQMLLASENPDYPDIKLQENSDCYVWGVVVGSVRQF